MNLFLADDVDDSSYVVHTSVDYTNCLVPGLDKIMAASYYWGVMDRYEAEDLLDNKPEGYTLQLFLHYTLAAWNEKWSSNVSGFLFC